MLQPGTQIARYEIQRRLGRGGMGAVYVAHDPLLGRMVAIKVFSSELEFPDARERFAREARSAAALSHPHIVTVFDYGEYDAQPYIVMEYVPGETLAQLIRRNAPITLTEKLRWVEELCAGVGYAHQMSVIHRDIKPSNLIVDRSGRLKILDFGIARVLGTGATTNGAIGTPGYIAPEQIVGEQISHRADLFSIGVVFYELLTYTEAFRGDTLAAIHHAVLTQEPLPLGQALPELDLGIVGVVEQLIRKNPSERFADAESVRLAVNRVRSRLETDDLPAFPQTLLRRDAPGSVGRRDSDPGFAKPGTGPGEKSSDRFPKATPAPTPGPKRTDREALARRREEQLRAALQQAHALLAQMNLEDALEACHQALTLDENHLEAIELEAAIHAEIEKRDRPRPTGDDLEPLYDGPTVLPGARPYDVTSAGEVSATTISFVASDRAVSFDDRVLTDQPATSVLSHAKATPPPVGTPIDETAADYGATILTRRSAAPPESPPLTTKDVGTSVRRTSVPVVPRWKKTGEDIRARFLATTLAARALVLSRPPRERKALLGGIAAIFVVAALAAGWLLTPAPAIVTGRMVIDAVPWATITAIESEGGRPVTLPAETTTPLSLSLPPGTYQVAVVGPPPESQMQHVSVRVDPNATNVASLLRFHAITAEEYFEQYLTSSSVSSAVDGEATSSVPPTETDGAAAPSAPALSLPASSTGVER